MFIFFVVGFFERGSLWGVPGRRPRPIVGSAGPWPVSQRWILSRSVYAASRIVDLVGSHLGSRRGEAQRATRSRAPLPESEPEST